LKQLEKTMRLPMLACLLGSMVMVAGCATETDSVDSSEGAASGAPGPAADRAREEAEAKKDQAFVDVTKPEILLARYESVPDDKAQYHFRESSMSDTCVANNNYVKLLVWDPYQEPDYSSSQTVHEAIVYATTLAAAGFRKDLVMIQRATDAEGTTFDLKLVAIKKSSLLCAGDKYSDGARVVLHCTNVGSAKGSGPDPRYCSAPARGSAEANPS
jgi:hypothetical protein